MLSEIVGRLTTGQLLADRGEVQQAVQLLPEVEDLLRRGIDCGAFADPWNLLGFQGLFPLFTAREVSIRDTRIDELVHVVEQVFNLYSRLVSELAASGATSLQQELLGKLRKLATWWEDRKSTRLNSSHRC